MESVLIYILLGAMMSVWTAINQINDDEQNDADDSLIPYIFAYILIAIVWPVSLVVSVYAVVSELLLDNPHG